MGFSRNWVHQTHSLLRVKRLGIWQVIENRVRNSVGENMDSWHGKTTSL